MKVLIQVLLILIIILKFDNAYCKDELVISTLQLYPWSYIEKGKTTGAFYEPMELIRKKYSGKMQHLIIPLNRALKGMTENNSYDLALFTPGPHSKKLIDLGVVLDGVMLIALPRKGIKINSIEDFKDLKIGTPRGISAYTPVIDSSKYNVQFSNDNTYGLKMLKNQRTDVYVETNVSISSVAKALNFNPENYEKPFVLIKGEVFHAHLWLNKSSTITVAQRDEIQTIIKDLYSKGEFQLFVDKRTDWLNKIP